MINIIYIFVVLIALALFGAFFAWYICFKPRVDRWYTQPWFDTVIGVTITQGGIMAINALLPDALQFVSPYTWILAYGITGGCVIIGREFTRRTMSDANGRIKEVLEMWESRMEIVERRLDDVA